jgi:hypothetical protein
MLFAMIYISSANSAARTWTGNVSTDWGTAGNWSPASVPGSGDDPTIPTSPLGGRFPIVSANYAANNLLIQAGATLTQTSGNFILHDITIAFGTTSGSYEQISGILQIDHDWKNSGVFNSTGGTVQFTGNAGGGATFATGKNQFFNIIVNTGVDPHFDADASSLVLISGNFTNYNTGLDNSTNVTFRFTGSADQYVYSPTSAGKTSFGNIEVSKTGGTVYLNSNIEISGNAALSGGTFDIGSYIFKRETSGGSFTLNNSSTLKIGGTNGMPTSFTTRSFSSTSTVEYSGSTQTINVENYGNLILSGLGIKTFTAGTTRIANSFSIVSPAAADAMTNNSIIEYNGVGSQTINPMDYYNVVLSGSGIKYFQAGTTSIAGSLSINGSISINTVTNTSNVDYNGATDQNVLAIDYYDLTLSNAGTKYFGAGTVGIGGTLEINDLAVVDAETYNDTIRYFLTDKTVRYGFVNKNVKIDENVSASATTDLTITNSLIISPNASLDMNGYVLSVGTTLINNGNYKSTNPIGSMSFYSKNLGDYNSLDSWSNSDYDGETAARLPGTIDNDVLIIGNNKTINLTSNISNLGTVTVDSSGTLNPGTYVISGAGEFNLRKGGTLKITSPNGLNPTSGSIQTATRLYDDAANYEFSGTSAQVTGTEFPAKVGNLMIDNPDGVLLSSSLRLTGNLTLNNGKLTLEDYNLTLSPVSSVIGTPSNAKMIVTSAAGQLRKEFTSAGSFTFPVGDNTETTEYSPLTLNFSSGTFTSAFAGVNVINAKHPQNSSVTHYINRYWTVTTNGIADFSCNISCIYTDADIQPGAEETKIYMRKYRDSKWSPLNIVNASTNELSGTVSSFSDFTGGEIDALPVELISFNASVKNNFVELTWTTATEVNNYGFEIERSDDNTTFSRFSFIRGYGNSNSMKHYSYKDENLPNGNYYYRLKQIDNDGSFSYSKVINVIVDITPNNFTLFQNYPNPFNPVTKIKYSVPSVEALPATSVQLRIYDILGNEVATLVNEEQASGFYEVEFDGLKLSSGTYIYKIKVGNSSETKKMILSK